jgi:hypothetical protein
MILPLQVGNMIALTSQKWGILFALSQKKVGNCNCPKSEKVGNYNCPAVGNTNCPEAILVGNCSCPRHLRMTITPEADFTALNFRMKSKSKVKLNC